MRRVRTHALCWCNLRAPEEQNSSALSRKSQNPISAFVCSAARSPPVLCRTLVPVLPLFSPLRQRCAATRPCCCLVLWRVTACLAPTLHMATPVPGSGAGLWDVLRKEVWPGGAGSRQGGEQAAPDTPPQARKLEGEVDSKLASFSKLGECRAKRRRTFCPLTRCLQVETKRFWVIQTRRAAAQASNEPLS